MPHHLDHLQGLSWGAVWCSGSEDTWLVEKRYVDIQHQDESGMPSGLMTSDPIPLDVLLEASKSHSLFF